MSHIKTKCVFGPVPSRRLGLSMGIDLLPFKTCSMDCVYCECGATTDLTCERKEYFPTSEVIRELDEVLDRHPKFDCLTFSGVGEPTLHSGIGEIIAHVRKKYGAVKMCLLTNGTLLNDDQLLKEIASLTVMIPSLDGSNEEELQKVNRQEESVTLKSVVAGLIKCRRVNPQITMLLEIFVVPGVNDSPASAERFRKLVEQIRPDRVQLNSLDRPGVAEWLRPADPAVLDRMAAVIGQAVPVDIVARHQQQVELKETDCPDVTRYNDLILETLRKSPCTAAELEPVLGIPADRIVPHLRRMERAGLVRSLQGSEHEARCRYVALA